ncbi:hypothetical protein [Poriferisphaera sp. WC338]|uniref:hypothetical protein n=1 Tax=Poriferisphaera sp. WC338 TaxID=3425129 RepID=UPI003D8152ED
MSQTKIAKKNGLKKVIEAAGSSADDPPAVVLTKLQRAAGVQTAETPESANNNTSPENEKHIDPVGNEEIAVTPEQHKAMLKKAQQAEKRVRLGMQLLKASENRLSAQTHLMNQVRSEQDVLREKVQEDVAKSLQSYDQWIGQIDESFSKAMLVLEEKVDTISNAFAQKQSKLDALIETFESQIKANQKQSEELQSQIRACEVQVEDAVSFLLKRSDIPSVSPQKSIESSDSTPDDFGDIPIRPLKLAQPLQQRDDEIETQNELQNDTQVDPAVEEMANESATETDELPTLKIDPASALEALAEKKLDDFQDQKPVKPSPGKNNPTIYSKLLDELRNEGDNAS